MFEFKIRYILVIVYYLVVRLIFNEVLFCNVV